MSEKYDTCLGTSSVYAGLKIVSLSEKAIKKYLWFAPAIIS
jgi:hypothetical protein